MNNYSLCKTSYFHKITLFIIFAASFCAVVALNSQFNVNSASAALSGSDVDTEAECRWCHCGVPEYVPDQHHLKVGQTVPGTSETYGCLGQCHSMTQVQTPYPHYEFIPFRDCIQCHTASPYPGHHGRTDYTCTDCHEMRWAPSINAIVTVLMNWCGGTPMPAYDPPTAVAGPDKEVLVGATVNFDGSNSYDTELTGYRLSYQWDFGDGDIRWGRKQSKSYPNSGTYEAKLTVYNYACSTDPCTISRCGVPCLTGSDSVIVKVRPDLTQNISPIANAGPDIVTGPGSTAIFDLTGTTDPDGAIAYMSIEFGDGQQVVSPAVNVSHVYNAVGNYTARLTVYDDDGATATDEVTVHVVNPEICNNGIDDNGDGLTDCADRAACGTLPACIEAGNCADGIDNDFNGSTDCADRAACGTLPACIETGNCADGIDNDFNGLTDCADRAACGTLPACIETGNCTDTIDNDSDGLVDCADADCASTCNPKEICGDRIDNDGDGLIDCKDTNGGLAGTTCTSLVCEGKVLWNNCADKKDNDGDGKTDAKDPDCR